MITNPGIGTILTPQYGNVAVHGDIDYGGPPELEPRVQ